MLSATASNRTTLKVFIVLPAYNEAQNLKKLLPDLNSVLSQKKINFEIVVVNDGSRDETEFLVKSEIKKGMPATLLSHEKNQGLGATIRDGLEWAAQQANPEDVIISLDADNSHSPKHMEQMLESIQRGSDLVIASRYQRGAQVVGVPSFRIFLSYGARFLFQVFFPMKNVRDYTCGYRAYRASLLKAGITKYGKSFIDREGFEVMVDILLKLRKLKPRCSEVPLDLRYDQKQGVSKMRVFRTVKKSLVLVFTRQFRTI